MFTNGPDQWSDAMMKFVLQWNSLVVVIVHPLDTAIRTDSLGKNTTLGFVAVWKETLSVKGP